MQKEIKADAIIVGGGLSGCFAAIALKKINPDATVWLIERYGFLGGMATAGYVFPFMKYWTRTNKSNKEEDKSKFKRLTGGLFQEMLERMHMEGNTEKKARNSQFYQRFDPMMMRMTLDEMISENGVNVLFHSLVNAVQLKDKNEEARKIEKIIIQTKAGSIEGKAKIFIDSTGDADLAFHSGAECRLGRKEDGLTQPATLNFRIGNISPLAPGRGYIGKKIREFKENGNSLTPRDDCLMFQGHKNKEQHFNQTRVAGYDFTDPFELSAAEMEGRKQAKNFINFLQSEIRGFKKSTVMNVGTSLGIRESRRILGEYELTEEDLKQGTLFEDRIALGNYSIDIHDPKGTAKTHLVHFPEGHYYSIPFRSCIPKNFSNLLVAGRPISSTHEAHSAIRVMPICSAIGQGVGVGAALYLKELEKNKEKSVRDLDGLNIRKYITEQGGCVD